MHNFYPPPNLAPGQKEGQYFVEYRCSNCRRPQAIYYNVGTLAKEKSDKPCNNCGCKTLVR